MCTSGPIVYSSSGDTASRMSKKARLGYFFINVSTVLSIDYHIKNRKAHYEKRELEINRDLEKQVKFDFCWEGTGPFFGVEVQKLNYSIMHSNIWNLRGSKERLQIMERTEAHKRHLINIITAKCKISTRNSLSFRQAPSSPISLYRRRVINEDNHNLAKKLTSLTKGGLCERNDSSVVLSRNLKTYSSVNRNMRRRQIEEENGRMLSRLIMTSPTIKRQSLMKSQVQISKYKENLNRSKYRQPDYSQQACKLISREPKFKLLNLALSERKTNLIKRTRAID